MFGLTPNPLSKGEGAASLGDYYGFFGLLGRLFRFE